MSRTILIGEKINSSNNRIKSILSKREKQPLMEIVRKQEAGKASFVDVNASMMMKEEWEALEWAVELILENSRLGVSVDSSDSGILFRAAEKYGERILINSLSSDSKLISQALRVLGESGASAIIMLKSREKMPAGVEERLELADMARGLIDGSSVSSDRIFLDPVFTPAALSAGGMWGILDTVSRLKEDHPRYRVVGGLSNISYGMPSRRLINRTFLGMLLSRGMDAIIADVTDAGLLEALITAEFLLGYDEGGRGFLQYYRSRRS